MTKPPPSKVEKMNEMPNCPTVEKCHCGLEPCPCGLTERALRSWIAGPGYLPPMTSEQREWCLNEIDSVEGYSRKAYKGASSYQLASGVLSAWTDYCRDKGLL